MWNDLLDLTVVEELWPDAVDIDPTTLESLFISAHELCMAYAPLLPAGAAVPMRYKHAEIMQAHHLWTQFRGGNRDTFDSGDLVPASYPLVFAARDLLRPKRSPLSRLG